MFLLTLSTAPISKVRLKRKNMENLPRRNTKKGTGTKERPVFGVWIFSETKKVKKRFSQRNGKRRTRLSLYYVKIYGTSTFSAKTYIQLLKSHEKWTFGYCTKQHRTISGRSLLHRHACCTQSTTRYDLHSEQNNQPTGVATSPKKRFCLTSSLCFSCAHERVMTFPMNASACSMGTSKKQDGAWLCMEHVHVRAKRYSLPCEHKKHREIIGQRPCCGCACTPSGTATLSTPKNMTGLGVRETAVSVR